MAAGGSILISDRAFWRPGPGAALRQREILSFLVERGPVDLVYAGAEVGEFHRLAVQLAAAAATREIRCEALPPSLDPRRAADRFAALVAERTPGRVVTFAPELAWVADLVPAAVPVVLDVAGPPADAETEARLLDAARACDLALFDDLRRHRAAAAALGAARCAWSPQPVAVAEPLPPRREAVARIGVSFGVGAVDPAALAWLHDAVWRRAELARFHGAVEVVVGGDPGDGAAARACPDFRFVGPIDRPQPFFAAVDVVVAPQTDAPPPIEAFGFARPLLAAAAAAAGLIEAIAPACMVAETPADFAAALALLLSDAGARRRFADAGLDVARRLFAPEACFRPVLEAVAHRRPPPARAHAAPPDAPRTAPPRAGAVLRPLRADDPGPAAPPAVAGPQPRVALACAGDPASLWEPVWRLPGVAVVRVDAGDPPPPDSDLVITTDPGLAARRAAAGRPVWLCGEGGGDSPYLKAFPERDGRGWAVAEISAHLAVWARVWRATNATTKPIAAEGPEGYIPR